jgi:histidinol-phosphate aminotransferase
MPRFRPHLLSIPPYTSARDEYEGEAQVFLDANENSHAPSWGELHYRYPDPHHRALRGALAAYLGVSPEEVACGAGSDELIDWLLRVTTEPKQDTLLTVTPSYGVYSTYAQIHGIQVRAIRLNTDFSLPVKELLQASDHAPIAILCRPNNPTGTLWPATQVEQFIEAFPGWIVLDEAYVEFSAEPEGWLPRRSPRVILLRTFSKAWGMAGWRVGYMIASPEVVSLFYRTKLPYNLSTPAQEAALAALQRREQVHQSIVALRTERERLANRLSTLPNVQVFPSEANFLLIRIPRALQVYQALLRKGIVVRYRGSLPLCEDTLRVTIGTPEENTAFFEALCAIFS